MLEFDAMSGHVSPKRVCLLQVCELPASTVPSAGCVCVHASILALVPLSLQPQPLIPRPQTEYLNLNPKP